MSKTPDFYVYEWNDGWEGGSVARSLSPIHANFMQPPDKAIPVFYSEATSATTDGEEKVAFDAWFEEQIEAGEVIGYHDALEGWMARWSSQ